MRSRRGAYTLLELVLVLAVFTIVVGLSAPTVYRMYEDHQVRADSDVLRSAYADARAHAIEDSRPYRVALGHGTVRVAPDDPSYWSGNMSEEEHYEQSSGINSGPSFKENSDSGGASDSGSDWKTIAIFQPDGTARGEADDNPATVTLSKEGAGKLKVVLRGMTGTSHVEKVK
jgi:Tfp pilus assembly protein FimT